MMPLPTGSEYRSWRILTGEGIQTVSGRTAREAAQNQYRTSGRVAYSIALILNIKRSHGTKPIL